MKPMLAKTLGPKFNSFPCYCQPKLNGVRALFQYDPLGLATFQSRDEKIWGETILEHLVYELSTIKSRLGPLILDGELYVHGWRLQDINAAIAVNRKEPSDKTDEVEFHVFDVVDPNRYFEDRWFELYSGLQQAKLLHIIPVPTAVVHDRTELDQHFRYYTSLGYEGIMLRPNGPYEFGEHMAKHGQNMTSFRSKFLWKHKQWEDDEFVCVGTTQGEGKADIGIGALVLECNYMTPECIPGQGIDTFKVGTGLTDADRVEFFVRPPIGKKVKVRYLELTKDGIPFNPSFIAVL